MTTSARQDLKIPEEHQEVLNAGHQDDEAHLQDLGHALGSLTEASDKHEIHEGILAPAHEQDPDSQSLLKRCFRAGWAKFTKDAAYYHYGNYVVDRTTGEASFEQMPIYTRLGMHMLYCGSITAKMIHDGYAQKTFVKQSIYAGTIFDSPSSKSKISGFVKSFNLPLGDLLNPDLESYDTFNDFFSRAIKPESRPIAEPEDETVIVSTADCRLVVFPTTDLATQFWIKGRSFSIPNLIESDLASSYHGSPLAIFRLAPQDYHRWHCPLSGRITAIHDIQGTLMTVNPMAINENLDVFTENKRSVASLLTPYSKFPVFVVAIGAMLVGSIEWTVKEGQEVRRGQEMGLFKYGGSTVILVFPADFDVRFDPDLVANSEGQTRSKTSNVLDRKTSADAAAPATDSKHVQTRVACETLVRVGERVGRIGAP